MLMNLSATDYYFTVQYACRKNKPFSTMGLRIYWNGQVIFDKSGA